MQQKRNTKRNTKRNIRDIKIYFQFLDKISTKILTKCSNFGIIGI